MHLWIKIFFGGTCHKVCFYVFTIFIIFNQKIKKHKLKSTLHRINDHAQYFQNHLQQIMIIFLNSFISSTCYYTISLHLILFVKNFRNHLIQKGSPTIVSINQQENENGLIETSHVFNLIIYILNFLFFNRVVSYSTSDIYSYDISFL